MRTFRRSAAFAILATAVAAVAACSSQPTPPDLSTRLASDTGTPWTVYTDPRSQEVRFLAPKTPVAIGSGTPEEKARAFFQRYSDALHATGKSDEIRLVSSATDRRGGIHIRFAHFLPGTDIPVFGAGSTAHFTADGAVYWLEADFRADLAAVDGHATVSKDAAIATAIARVSADCGTSDAPTAAATELGVLSDPDTRAALVYRVAIDARSGTCLAPSVLVDAKSGVALKIEEGASSVQDPTVGGSLFFRAKDFRDVKPISVSEVPGAPGAPSTFQMASNDAAGTRVITHRFDTGAVIQTKDIGHWDEASSGPGAAADAQFHSREAMKFLRSFAFAFEAHGKNFVAPLSLDVDATVHDNREANSFGFNAFATIDPTTNGDIIHFGDGQPAKFTNALPFSAAYDVVAHELTHLITMHTSKLKYERESGALNESFSDVMGASAEHALFPDDTSNFLIGEKLFVPGMPGLTSLRSMTAPRSASPPGADHTDVESVCTAVGPNKDNDRCGVHTNSGIPNRAFSLIVQGGTVMNFSNGVATGPRPVGVEKGIGWQNATELTYWATTGLNATATFENAAYAQIAEAARLVDTDPTIAQAVVCAWHAVGVLKGSAEFEALLGSTVCKPSTPPAPAPGPQPVNMCEDRGDSRVCDVAATNSSLQCAGGFPVPNSEELCADPNTRCKTVSGDDNTAVLGSDGLPVCE